MIKNIEEIDLSKRYTYADYLTWQFEEMVELIRGKVFRMSPAPNLAHQRISTNFLHRIAGFLEGKTCEVFHAPFDVRLPIPPANLKHNKVDTVVQPDICVVCDPEKLDSKGCNGAPDWIIEILSPGTAAKDLKDKFDVYEYAGVREYWVVHPFECTLFVYRLNQEGRYVGASRPFVRGDKVPVGVLGGFQLDLNEIFPSNE